MRPPAQYSQWLEATFSEQTEMVLAHLIKLSGAAGDKKIIVDGFFSLDVLEKVSEFNRVVFLLSSEEVVRRDYFHRECKRDMYECILGLSNPDAALENVFQTMFYKQEEKEKEILESRFKAFKRAGQSNNLVEVIQQIEEHFGFD
ncbi:hypothetical protein [Paenibacillus glycanilyticus]|uniref:Uncharacterized protein n=1 Tax=Paenibacillus glycanilyticus TaxID=126569 RepID=A0ABQ6GAS6_9BACL|nr:hypothetical protein [Paenibacillus glycanilyticus]GLX68049.1 hypothetical protein MU1_23940 [Paenibacillus glycanilyticus]